jgi:polyisoprenoid-binding protein YceI
MDKSKDTSRVFHGNLLPAPGEYVVDTVHSFAEFAVQHIIVGQVWGRFDSISGTIRVADDPLLSTVEVAIDTASINTHHKDRDNDLRSPRFFDVEKYPKMTFVSTGIKTEPKGRFTVDGNLTLCGLTRAVPLAVVFTGIVDDPWGNTRAAFQAKTSLNRKDFGLVADLDRETGGLLVGKDVRIKMAIEALLKK